MTRLGWRDRGFRGPASCMMLGDSTAQGGGEKHEHAPCIVAFIRSFYSLIASIFGCFPAMMGRYMLRGRRLQQ